MIMAKQTSSKKIKLVDFPEEVTEEGLKVYGETSYENMLAVLSHYFHNEGALET